MKHVPRTIKDDLASPITKETVFAGFFRPFVCGNGFLNGFVFPKISTEELPEKKIDSIFATVAIWLMPLVRVALELNSPISVAHGRSIIWYHSHCTGARRRLARVWRTHMFASVPPVNARRQTGGRVGAPTGSNSRLRLVPTRPDAIRQWPSRGAASER